MTTACFSLTSAANGSAAPLMAVRTECGRHFSRVCTGRALSVSSSLSQELKLLSLVPCLPYGCGAIFSKSASRNTVVAVGGLDLESPASGLDSSEGPDFVSNTALGAESGSKLYVGNLPWSCDSQQLADIFQDAGNVEVVEVIYDRETGRSRGFGFVKMASAEEAEAAIANLDGYELGGRPIKVNIQLSQKGVRAQGSFGSRDDSGGSDNSSKVFVGNLAWEVDDGILEGLFNAHGNIIDAKVIYDRDTGRSRGFGFVTFSSSSEANDAVSVLNGSDYEGRPLRVNIAADKPRRF